MLGVPRGPSPGGTYGRPTPPGEDEVFVSRFLVVVVVGGGGGGGVVVVVVIIRKHSIITRLITSSESYPSSWSGSASS